ncbi:hypothetical protein QBC38DRAFT_493366 [Podospora fimiseda]|uniref:Integral membrane protein TmpA n=1 Tax=Podospora fimiseda TaxID=252190 RepID=A0AAN6YQ88_9PEZI|nr:hypothetical protein QBC38DRAFT_493366 [Podospora fimiseda]
MFETVDFKGKKDEIIETTIVLDCPVPSSPSDSTSSDLSSSVSSITKEKESTTDLEAQDTELSQKPLSFFRYAILNVYKRLFTITFLANIITFILLLALGPPSPISFVNASAVNLAVCGLTRQPLVINALFLLFGSVPRSSPVWLKKLCCKIFHLGGIHSGTGIASAIWYIGFATLYTSNFIPSEASPTSIAILTLIYLILLSLLTIIIVAHPKIRQSHHDLFELLHRYFNWLILILFWALLFLMAFSFSIPPKQFLLPLPAFWILILLTLATIYPWLLLRRIKIQPESLSPHAIRLHFSHTQIKFGQGISLSKNPLKDWHAFACFPDLDSTDTKFSCLVSKAGDWTASTISEKPVTLWKRGIPTYGFGYVLRMYSRIIVVTTGSGIGPCLSFLGDENRPAMRVLWQTRSPEKTYGKRTLELVRKMDNDPVIIDTSAKGKREDMLPVVLRMVNEFEAEAVCVISNPKMTGELVYGLESRGVLAYGPIFDS